MDCNVAASGSLVIPETIEGKSVTSIGNYSKAEALYKRALEIEEKALGPDHPVVAISLYNLAHLYRATNRDDEVKQLEKHAEEIRAIKR